ncbi:hypothetical protein [Thiomicrorhabdus arctica]|uniref:hypothetical protein n=1 Tax=Thiomicrorhabdus arctica TaxID=131540 RepID=UPI0012FE0317|nr:hypothetical protein [Thiomicrorhabdus arctica]
MSIEMRKLQLLTHSKNMLTAAQQSQWTRFSELEAGWLVWLQASVEKYGKALNSIGSELINDNQKIQECFILEQKKMLRELEQSTKNTSSIKSYLK